MADTEVLTGDAATVKRWATKLWQEMPHEIYWGKMMGEDDKSCIQVKRDLEGVAGDQLTYTLQRKLSGAGVTGDAVLEGNEEQLVWYSYQVTLDQVRNAVRLKGRLSERRTAFDQRMSANNTLKFWLAEYIDDDIFTQFDSSPTSVIFGGPAVSTATIDSTSTLTLAKIDAAVAKARKASPKIWPVKVDNRDYYVLCMHTDVEYDVRQSTAWQTHQENAGPRDYGDNQLFSGGMGVYAGVVLHSHEKVPVATNYGSGADQPGASNMFLGRQAGLFAWGRRPEWWEKEFDYGARVGFAIGAIWDFKKAVFNAADNAYIAIRTFRTNN